MSKFYIVGGSIKRSPHTGLVVTAYYKQDPNNPYEKPQTLTMFNRWPTVEIDAKVVDVPLNGIYEYPNKKRVTQIQALAVKTKEGLWYKGYSPAELVAKRMNLLKKVSEVE